MDRSIRVAVAGAHGRLGSVAAAAFAASPEFAYAGGLARVADPAQELYASIGELAERGVDVLLDATTQPDSVEISMAALAHGIRPVIGASGWSDADREALAARALERGLGAMIVPNFSVGALLAMALAEQAARYFPASEIVETHRAEKKDTPSGTALETAARIERAGGMRPQIHSVRLPGAVAHQEVLFGGSGELLSIRHDSFSRECFVPGMFAAVRAVMGVRGLVVGLPLDAAAAR